MNVKELIEKLETYDPNLEIVLGCDGGLYQFTDELIHFDDGDGGDYSVPVLWLGF